MTKRRTRKPAATSLVLLTYLTLAGVAVSLLLMAAGTLVPPLLIGTVIVLALHPILKRRYGIDLLGRIRYHVFRPTRRVAGLLIRRAVATAPPKGPGSGREPIAPSLRWEVLQRDHYRCVYCGRSQVDGAKLEIDHKVAVSRGGRTELNNLVTACFECNRGKGARPVIDWR